MGKRSICDESGYRLHEQPGTVFPPENGYHKTGDVVNVDDDGFIFIVDRVKRFAKIGGEMVSLTAVESIIQALYPEHHHAIISLTR